MDSRDALLADFDHEIAVTRRLIERIPGDSLAWKPHHRSFSLGELATHLAKLPRWGAQILEHPSHDLLSGTGVSREGATQAGMGLAVADPDGDLDFDILVTNFDDEPDTL